MLLIANIGLLLFIIITIIFIYHLNSLDSKLQNQITESFASKEGFYFTITVKDGRYILKKGDEEFMKISGSKLIDHKKGSEEKIEEINSAPHPKHYLFNGTKIFLIKDGGKIELPDHPHPIIIEDNEDQTETYYKIGSKIIASVKIRDEDSYLLSFEDHGIVSLLPQFFVAFTLLHRESA